MNSVHYELIVSLHLTGKLFFFSFFLNLIIYLGGCAPLLTVISFMFMFVLSFLKISAGHGAPPMRPGRRGCCQWLSRKHVCFVFFGQSYGLSGVLPASTDEKSYLCKSWLTMSVNIVGVP